MNKTLTTLDVLKGFADTVSIDASAQMPPDLMCSVMTANNRILAAAILQNGGELRVSQESIHASLASKTHIVAEPDTAGALKLTFATKEEIIHAPPEVLPL
jgi:hypothetical protein